jgi:soluble lytic murein transglycosylase-like protein
MRERIASPAVAVVIIAWLIFAAFALWTLVVRIGISSAPTVGVEVIPEISVKPPKPQSYNLPLAYASLVIYYCDETGVPVWIASRLFDWESGWNPQFRGKENENGSLDLGMAGLNSSYIDYFRIYNDGRFIDPFDAATAIRVGIRYLADLRASTGSWRGAVAAYNCGLGRWRTGRIPARTVEHVVAVMGEAK